MVQVVKKHDILFSLTYGYEIGFRYAGYEYWIFHSVKGKSGYTITQTPDNYLFTSDSNDWTEAMNQPVFNGKTLNDIFDQVEFVDYMVDTQSEELQNGKR
ncbi:hypothetical protein [Lacticaseibacillus saniviri]|uniref:hypothetical protein n=1 Tax=Lacticaseibacillus saniviri TaxID=931533 RepID=UPI0006CF7E2E|nr:hypothetical protein [Lacticaseibacillus saniviri]